MKKFLFRKIMLTILLQNKWSSSHFNLFKFQETLHGNYYICQTTVMCLIFVRYKMSYIAASVVFFTVQIRMFWPCNLSLNVVHTVLFVIEFNILSAMFYSWSYVIKAVLYLLKQCHFF